MSDEARKTRLSLVTGAASAGEAGEARSDSRNLTRRGMISRDRILEAALSLLAEGGYAALSISAVCKRAEVSPASLYHHFGDKAGLMAAMIEYAIVESSRRFAEIVSDHERPLDKIKGFFTATREIGRVHRNDAIAVLLTLAEARGDSPEVAAAVANARARTWAFVASEMSEILGIEDAMLLAHLQFAFASYITHVAQSSPDKQAAKALFRSYRRVFLVTAAALKPEFLHDPEIAAALAAASRSESTEANKEKGDD